MRLTMLASQFIAIATLASVADERRSLADAVNEFNLRQLEHSKGQLQPPLTTDEVVAAIRGWIRERTPVSDEIYKTYQEIADTGTLPPRAKLSYTSLWIYNGYEIDVWWVDLTVMTGEKAGYTFRIRDQKLSSRPNAKKLPNAAQ